MKSLRYLRSGELLPRFAIGLILLAAVAATAREDVKVYRVPKPVKADPHAGHGHGEGVMPVANFPQLKYKSPAGWTATPGGAMRVASFSITKDGKKADVSVIPLPGSAGGDPANVNRWRGQVGLEQLNPAALKKTAETVNVGSAPAELYDLGGTNSAGDASRILGVIYAREGTAWFFKMTGDDSVVASQKTAFIEFLKSVEFTAGGTPPPGIGATGDLPSSHPPLANEALPEGHPPLANEGLPAGHPPISTTPSAGPISREGQPVWTVPAGWKEVSGGQFLVAKFLITGEGGSQAAVNVSQSAGDGGGLASNVNRWRGQLGLSQLGESEAAKSGKTLKVNGGEATLVEMSGTDARTGQPAKVIGAILLRSGQSWFYKLMGDAKLVDANREVFTKFVTTVKY